MASFLLFMLNTNMIKYGTAQGYVGSVCNWHMDVLGGLGNPIADVIDWKRFCNHLCLSTLFLRPPTLTTFLDQTAHTRRHLRPCLLHRLPSSQAHLLAQASRSLAFLI